MYVQSAEQTLLFWGNLDFLQKSFITLATKRERKRMKKRKRERGRGWISERKKADSSRNMKLPLFSFVGWLNQNTLLREFSSGAAKSWRI